MTKGQLILSFVLLNSLVSTTYGQLPVQAVACQARLLSPRSDTVSVFDGVDTLYIFGGLFFDPDFNLIAYDEIHAYNVTSDTIEVVGTLPRTAYGGQGYLEEETRSILYFRGDGTFLWRYDPAIGITTSVTQWFGNPAFSYSVLTANNKWVAFGGTPDPLAIYQVDLTTLEEGGIGSLPLTTEVAMGRHSTQRNESFIFSGVLGERTTVLQSYDHVSNTTKKWTTAFPSFRHGDGSPIWVGDSLLILGALVDNGARGNGIIKFNPVGNGTVEFIPISGLPDELSSLSVVYVEAVRKLYIFGGYDFRNMDRDEIWYIKWE